MFSVNRWSIVIGIYLNYLIVYGSALASHKNSTSKINNNNEQFVKPVITLKNINYHPYDEVNKSANIRKPDINENSENIFLPLNPKNYHPDKVLERLQVVQPTAEHRPFDFLNFDAYIYKPIQVDYSKIFPAPVNVKSADDVQVTAAKSSPFLSNGATDYFKGLFSKGLHTDTSAAYLGNKRNNNNEETTLNANADDDYLKSLQQKSNKTLLDSYLLPIKIYNVNTTSSPAAHFTNYDYINPLPITAERLVLTTQPPPFVQSLQPTPFPYPTGFAFFDSLRAAHNSRPHYSRYTAIDPALEEQSNKSDDDVYNKYENPKPLIATTTTRYEADDVEVTTFRYKPSEAKKLHKKKNSKKSKLIAAQVADITEDVEGLPKIVATSATVNVTTTKEPEITTTFKYVAEYYRKPFRFLDEYKDDYEQSTTEEPFDDDDNHQKEDYSYRTIKTYSDSFGDKPGMKYNKYTRLKLIQREEPTTRRTKTTTSRYRPRNLSDRYATTTASSKKNSSRKKSAKLSKKPYQSKKNENSRGHIKYLYDSYVTHPEDDQSKSKTKKNKKDKKSHRDYDDSYEDLESADETRLSEHFQRPDVGPVLFNNVSPTISSYSIAHFYPSAQQIFQPVHSEPFINYVEARQKSLAPVPVAPPRKQPPLQPAQQTPQQKPRPQIIRYFQDIYKSQSDPDTLEYGHVMETPDGWEERYEKKDLKEERHQGKVIWADKKGGFGEHYYDLNHHKPAADDSHGKQSQIVETKMAAPQLLSTVEPVLEKP